MPPREKTMDPTTVFPCVTHEMRLDEHSDRIKRIAEKQDKHDDRLNAGDVSFAEIRKDFHTLTASVDSLNDTIRWVGGLVIAAVVTAAMSGILK